MVDFQHVLVILTLTIPAFALPTLNNSPSRAIDAKNTPSLDTSAKSTPCSPEVLALASGISVNIADQNNEVAAVTSLTSLLAESPVDTATFTSGQASLLTFVKKGISIRENNQKIAPAGNPALAGLAMVAMAQMEELNLTMSLGAGGVDVARDNKTVKMLLTDFRGGIVQNMKNLAAATGNCTVPAASPSGTPKKTVGIA